jgi:hypothetical protein
MKEKLAEICLFFGLGIGVAVILLSVLYGILFINIPSEKQEVICVDRNNNEMVGQTCLKEVQPEVLNTILYIILILVLLFISCLTIFMLNFDIYIGSK